MDPGTLIANIDEFKEVRVQARFLADIAKERFMGSWST
jgi:hypothetical protein